MTWGFWLAVALLAANAVRLAAPHLQAFQGSARGAIVPHTTVHKETIFDSNGATHQVLETTVAVRSDGSRAIVNRRHVNGTATSQRTIEMASGERAFIDDVHQAKSTTADKALGARAPAWLADPRSSCLNAPDGTPILRGQEATGEDTVHGYRAVKVRRGNITWWYALDYGCAMLARRAEWTNQVTERSLVELIPGEPQPALFQVPESYREVPPSEMTALSVPEAAVQRKDAWAKADQWYRAHRP